MWDALPGVYAIRNRLTGETYVGKARNLKTRRDGHTRLLESGVHHNRRLQLSWDSWGSLSFDWIVIYVCDTDCIDAYEWWALNLVPSGLRLNSQSVKRHEIPPMASASCEHAFRARMKKVEPTPPQIMSADEIRDLMMGRDLKKLSRESRMSLATLYRIRNGAKPHYATLRDMSDFFKKEATNG